MRQNHIQASSGRQPCMQHYCHSAGMEEGQHGAREAARLGVAQPCGPVTRRGAEGEPAKQRQGQQRDAMVSGKPFGSVRHGTGQMRVLSTELDAAEDQLQNGVGDVERHDEVVAARHSVQQDQWMCARSPRRACSVGAHKAGMHIDNNDNSGRSTSLLGDPSRGVRLRMYEPKQPKQPKPSELVSCRALHFSPGRNTTYERTAGAGYFQSNTPLCSSAAPAAWRVRVSRVL